MVTIVDYSKRPNSEGKEFIALVLQGGLELVKSQKSERYYATAKKAERRQVKIKLGLQGPSGSGKTYSSLLLAYKLTGNWSETAIIDTENFSADPYSHLGNYIVLSPGSPFTPERYVEAIRVCEIAGMEVIIIDSICHGQPRGTATFPKPPEINEFRAVFLLPLP